MSDRIQERIDTVTQAMQKAEPSPGIEQRILTRLHAAAMPQAEPAWWASFLPGYALAAGVMVAAVAGILPQHHGAQRRASQATLAYQSPQRTGQTDFQANALRGEAPHSVRGVAVPPIVERPTRARLVATEKPIGAEHPARSSEDDRSFPAPPLPLTEQERLLLRLVKHEPPTQLAELSAPAQEAAFQREKERVAEYFAKPIPPADPPDDQPSGTGQQ